MAGCRLDSTGSGHGPEVGPYEHSNEPLGSVKAGNLLTNTATIFSSRMKFFTSQSMTLLRNCPQTDYYDLD